MHRRVAQTVAVLPRRASQRPWVDPDSETEIAHQRTASSLFPHVPSTLGQRPTLDSYYDIDSHSYTDFGFRRMSSSDDSIASAGDHPRLSSSPVSMHHDDSASTMPQEDVVDTASPLQPETNEQLDDEFDEIEWELQNNGLYVGAFLFSQLLFQPSNFFHSHRLLLSYCLVECPCATFCGSHFHHPCGASPPGLAYSKFPITIPKIISPSFT